MVQMHVGMLGKVVVSCNLEVVFGNIPLPPPLQPMAELLSQFPPYPQIVSKYLFPGTRELLLDV